MTKFFIFALLTFTLTAFSAEELETNSFVEIHKRVIELGKKHGEKNVLLAIDIDNTLMYMPQNYGSDQWWNWQSDNCLKSNQKKLPSFCVTSNFSELIDLQGKIFAVSNMLPTDEKTVEVIKDLQTSGFKIILLTSRGHDFRNATYRALHKNKMNFKKSAIGPEGGYPSTFKPYDLSDVSAYGLTKEQATVAKLKTARLVSYMDGVFMGSGQHKGIMLKTLLHKTKTTPKAIVFADDHVKHTKSMHQIFGKQKNLELITYRYGKIDPMVEAFKKSDKKKEIQDHEIFSKSMNQIFK